MKHLILLGLFILFANSAAAENQSGTCGTNCNWVLENGKLSITGGANGEIGQMSNYSPVSLNSPWADYQNQITSVDIQGVTNVGSGAFYHFPIEKLTLGNTITGINWDAFSGAPIKTLELPPNLTYIENQAFQTSTLETIIISDKINYIAFDSLGTNPSTLKNAKIICRGDNCDRVKELFKEYVVETYVNGEWIYTPTDISSSVVLAGEDNCDSSGYYWSGKFCHNRPTDGGAIECDEGWYVTNKDVCARIKLRYTLPEADEATSNDNENMIEWIFE